MKRLTIVPVTSRKDHVATTTRLARSRPRMGLESPRLCARSIDIPTKRILDTVIPPPNKTHLFPDTHSPHPIYQPLHTTHLRLRLRLRLLPISDKPLRLRLWLRLRLSRRKVPLLSRARLSLRRQTGRKHLPLRLRCIVDRLGDGHGGRRGGLVPCQLGGWVLPSAGVMMRYGASWCRSRWWRHGGLLRGGHGFFPLRGVGRRILRALHQRT